MGGGGGGKGPVRDIEVSLPISSKYGPFCDTCGFNMTLLDVVCYSFLEHLLSIR